MIDTLYHYYEKSRGPFLSLSNMPIGGAQAIMNRLKQENDTFAAHRYDGYLERRYELEALARRLFVEKGGRPQRDTPHYMVVGACDWLKSWYNDGDCVRIPIGEFDRDTVSFSYGDLFPTFSPRVADGREYRSNIYTYDEILGILSRYGLPQSWNADGKFGPERYVEVQVWSDNPIQTYYGGNFLYRIEN